MSTATEMLSKYLEAEVAVLAGKVVQFNGRALTMADLADIRTGRQEWQRIVNAEAAQAAGAPTIGGLGYSVARFD